MENKTRTQIKDIIISSALAIIVGILVFYGMGFSKSAYGIAQVITTFNVIVAVLVIRSLIKWRGFTKFSVALVFLNTAVAIFTAHIL